LAMPFHRILACIITVESSPVSLSLLMCPF
jgi:hypothetical protein